MDTTGFECTDGTYRLCSRLRLARPPVSIDEHAELAPNPARLSFTSFIEPTREGAALDQPQPLRSEAVYLTISCRKLLYVYRNYNILKHFTYDTTSSYEPMDHDFNQMTRSPQSTLIACCFSSGAVVIYDVVSGRARWINKHAEYTRQPATAVSWLPGQETLLLVGHSDGSVYLLDAAYDHFAAIPISKRNQQVFSIHHQPESNTIPVLAILRDKIAPVSCISCSKDCESVAITFMDGLLLVLDRKNWTSRFAAHSYYGGFTCVSWSADCKFLVTGGEDDLVTSFFGKHPCRSINIVAHSFSSFFFNFKDSIPLHVMIRQYFVILLFIFRNHA
eukprot:m.217222 g.217222  ORF g.217222 m.217222 type:complete len:333 (-) comp16986_c19_seq7:928-1926(-)